MRTHEELKQLLIRIKDNGYKVPDGTDVDGLVADMLKFIGHTDAELRDDLIYTTFCELAENGTLSAAQLKHCLATCLSDTHLFYGIGESSTDSVFTRAFSSLFIALALAIHDENPFLTSAEIQNLKNVVLRYAAQEKDYRGYVSGKGWAHATAHVADALTNIAGCDKAVDVEGDYSIGREGMHEVLQAVKTLVCVKDNVYTTEEDERLTQAVQMVIWCEILTTQELTTWIDSFDPAAKMDWSGPVPDNYYLHVNRKNFMRSLYFTLLADKDYEEICKHMVGFLAKPEEE